MGQIKSIIEAIETRLIALGFAATNEVFDFDSIPNSVIDKAFRIENRILENTYNLGDQANLIEAIEIYIAYKLKRNARTTWKAAIDDRETVEKDLINNSTIAALTSDPILAMNQEASTQKYLDDYLISRLIFSCDYLRDINV